MCRVPEQPEFSGRLHELRGVVVAERRHTEEDRGGRRVAVAGQSDVEAAFARDGEQLRGTAVGIDAAGRLLIAPDAAGDAPRGPLQAVTAGDVSLRLAPDATVPSAHKATLKLLPAPTSTIVLPASTPVTSTNTGA